MNHETTPTPRTDAACNDTPRWVIKKGDFDGKPYLWDSRHYDNYDLWSLCDILNEYEEKTNEVARLRELLNRAIENCECDPECSSIYGSRCDCGRYRRNNQIKSEIK